MRAAALLWSVAGLIGWAGAFSLVYALHGIGCASEWQQIEVGPTNLQRFVLVAAFSACLLGVAVLAAWLHWRRARAFADGGETVLASLTQASAWVGLAATVFTLFPVLTTSVCR